MAMHYKIKKERVEDGYYYDVYVLSEGVWEIIDSFQTHEAADAFIANDIKNSRKED